MTTGPTRPAKVTSLFVAFGVQLIRHISMPESRIVVFLLIWLSVIMVYSLFLGQDDVAKIQFISEFTAFSLPGVSVLLKFIEFGL